MTSGGNAIIREAVAHVLIIDDDPSVILTLSRMLEFEGHQVATVESAQAAYLAVDARPPDAIPTARRGRRREVKMRTI